MTSRILSIALEEWTGSPVVWLRRSGYRRLPASSFKDKPARLGERQAVFYRNLLRIAVELGTLEIPVDFELSDGTAVFLDRGCIKIAEYAGFIHTLENDASGTVSTIRLALRC